MSSHITHDTVAPPLRVGVMLDAQVLPAWIIVILRQLLDAAITDLSLVILNAEPITPDPRFARLRAPRRRHLLYNLYNRIDARLFRAPVDATAREDATDLLAPIPKIYAVPLRPKPFEHRFQADTVDAVRQADLDVLLRFGFNIIRGDILSSARYGVWSYHHGDHREYRGMPDLFWEMYEGNPVSGSILQLLSNELDGGKVLHRSFSATDPASLHRGRNKVYWKSAAFVMRRMIDLHRSGWTYLESSRDFEDTGIYTKPLYCTPTNLQMLRFISRLSVGLIGRQLGARLFEKNWHVAFARFELACIDGANDFRALTLPRGRFRTLPAPPGRYYADPFVVQHQDREYVLFEDYDKVKGSARISWSEISEDGRASAPQPALERDYHLSYPCVFAWRDEWYMVPETRERRAIELFRAIEFPHDWEFVQALISDADAVDATVFAHQDRLWMFANMAVSGAAVDDELCLFHSTSPFGPWTPHPMNPVVSDVRRARPAGRVFARDGTLIRPSQDCSRCYGYAVVFNVIQRLTPDDYAESPIGRMDPRRRSGDLATHTFNSDGTLLVIDTQRRRLRRPGVCRPPRGDPSSPRSIVATAGTRDARPDVNR